MQLYNYVVIVASGFLWGYIDAMKGRASALSPEALDLVASTFRVLGEPVRLRILQLLQEGEHPVTELAAKLGTTQPNVSKHLRVLQEAGLVSRQQLKNAAIYRIADETVFELCDVVCNRMKDRLLEQIGVLDPRRRR